MSQPKPAFTKRDRCVGKCNLIVKKNNKTGEEFLTCKSCYNAAGKEVQELFRKGLFEQLLPEADPEPRTYKRARTEGAVASSSNCNSRILSQDEMDVVQVLEELINVNTHAITALQLSNTKARMSIDEINKQK